MNPRSLLEATQTSTAVAVHKFVLIPNKEREKLYCFFEGKDTHYYSLRLNNYSHRQYEPIICGNKRQVIETYSYFKENGNFKEYPKAYFVDRDFDDLINNPEIYETPTYSIENLYVNSDTVREILKGEFFLTSSDEEFKKAVQTFEVNLAEFNNSVLLLNGWYYSMKEKKKREGLSTVNVSLGDKLPKGFVNLNIGSISPTYDLELIRTKFSDSLEVSDLEVNDRINELSSDGLESRLRGKYQLIFLKSILNFFIVDCNTRNVIFKSKTKFSLNEANLLSQLSQYAFTPLCLINYIKSFN